MLLFSIKCNRIHEHACSWWRLDCCKINLKWSEHVAHLWNYKQEKREYIVKPQNWAVFFFIFITKLAVNLAIIPLSINIKPWTENQYLIIFFRTFLQLRSILYSRIIMEWIGAGWQKLWNLTVGGLSKNDYMWSNLIIIDTVVLHLRVASQKEN